MDPVRQITPELLGSAGALLAEAFFTNPAHTYICPDPSRRRDQLEWLLGGNLRLQDLRASFCLTDGAVVDAMGFWTTSTAPQIGTLRKIRAGLLAAPRRLGWAGVRRLFEVTGEIDRHLAQALGGDRPYWYLNNMVVREHLRGTGIGTRLLRRQLALVAETEPSYAIALSTQRPENVTFYQRLGFHVELDRTIGSGAGAFRNWVMVQAASTPRASSS